MRLEVGMIIKTNYGTGPYRILDIERGCTCPLYLDDKPTPEHIHLTLTDPDGKGRSWIGYIIEETLTSVPETREGYIKDKEPDMIIMLDQGIPVQRSFL